jgi:hypothetical protein
MKKRLSLVSKVAAAVLGISLLLTISCANMVTSPREAAGTGETGTALISFGNGVEGARTLLPTEVSFERYDLTVEAVGHGAGPVTDTIYAGSSALIELAAGDWKIHVDAYTDTGGSNKAAEGDSEVFTISANATEEVSVTLKAISGSDNGTLSVTITGEDGVIDYGWLRIYGGTNFTDPVTFYNGWENNTSVSFGSNGLDLDISLRPGQYRVFAEIRNNEDQWAYINEVAWIYSNLTTNLDQIIVPGDFADTTLISGTVQYAENGVDLGDYELAVFTNSKGDGYSLGQTWIGSTGAQSYELRIPRPDKDVTLYFFIYKDNNRWLAGSASINAGQQTAAQDISLNRSPIPLSGTIGAVTVDGNEPSFVRVMAHTSDHSKEYWGSVAGSNWQIGIPDDFSGDLTIRVDVEYNDDWYNKNVTTLTFSGSPIPGINLGNIGFVILSGTFTVTIDGNEPSSVRVAARNLNNHSEEYWGWGSPDSNYWQIGIPDDFFGDLTIRFDLEYNGGWYQIQDVAIVTASGSSITDIHLGNTGLVILSGTFTATVDGHTPSSVGVMAHTSDYSKEYWGAVAGNNWQIGIPGNFSGDLAIRVNVEYDGGWYNEDVATVPFSGSSITGIHLKNINLVTLSGTLTVTVDGNEPSFVNVIARNPNDHSEEYSGPLEGNNWQIGVPGDFFGDLVIRLDVEYNGGWYHIDDVATVTASGSPITGIHLGNTGLVTLSGTLTVTVDGHTPSSIIVIARNPNDHSEEYRGPSTGSNWLIGVSDNFSGDLTIRVDIEYNGDWYHMDHVATVPFSGSPIPGIHLENINLVTLSGIVAATIDGHTPSSVNVVAYAPDYGEEYRGPSTGSNWLIGVPDNFSGDLVIRVYVEYNGDWYNIDDVATVPFYGSSVTGINLGNINLVTLSGTLAVTIDGHTPSSVNVVARNSDHSKEYRGPSDGNNWQVGVPDNFSGDLDIRLDVEYNGGWYNIQDVATVTVSGSSIPGINLGNINLVTLSGTLAVTIDGHTPSSVNVTARNRYNDHEQYRGPAAGSNWQVCVPDNFSGDLAIRVDFEYNGGGYMIEDVAIVTFSGSPIPGIHLENISLVTLSGTVAVTIDGHTPSSVNVVARNSDHSKEYRGPATGSNWQIGVSDNFSGDLTISVDVEYNGSWYSIENVVTVTASGLPIPDIHLENINLVTLSGTLTVTLDGNKPSFVRVIAQNSDHSKEYSGPVTGNNWLIGVPDNLSGDLTIRVDVEYNGGQYNIEDVATVPFSGSPVTGINLGNISHITLSGTIGTVTVNGNKPSSVRITAHTDDYSKEYSGSVFGNNWLIGVPDNFYGNLIIRVDVEYNGSWWSGWFNIDDVTTVTVSGSPVTIHLGDFPLTL